jgi:DNA end-binding protein Ku
MLWTRPAAGSGGAGMVRTMRSVWSGAVSFGLVSIPVKLYPATEAKDVRFHLVDPETGRRVRYRRVVEEDRSLPDVVMGEEDAAPGASEEVALEDDAGEEPQGPASPPGPEREEPRDREVAFEDLERAYEIEPGEQVTVTQEELRRLRPPRSRTIEIEDFVDLASIDPVYFEKSYVLAPEYGGAADKPYVLLMRALERAGRAGIGRFVLRTKPHLVAIRPAGGVLGLETMFFADEVREGSSFVSGVEDVTVSDQELRLAQTLIDTLNVEWDPARYSDTYREELLRRIDEKVPVARPESREEALPARARVDELMDALKASVEEAKKAKKQKRRSA